ncbi:MAG TPA: hypothetical protein P5514_09115 [Bacteroidales bacterium]|nr:hypothetical protein [Bacteroidales bacterium]HRX97090.1 hypothetical protein [Bacteroidales bacterium]
MEPKPFYFNKSNIRAIVLGADPTNYSDHGKQVNLHYAFGIGQDPRYFQGILENLNLLGLHLEDIYIDNLMTGYQGHETSKNKNFVTAARQHVPELKKQLSKIKNSKNLPVFITAYDIYKALLKDGEKVQTAQSLYSLETEIPIPVEKNLLGRSLIPLFRHDDYTLSHHKEYLKYLQTILKKG